MMPVHREEGDQQSVIAFLTRPHSYGIADAVERIDTHAAIIFLAGARAYKLKRAIKYSYLDFSTPAKRKAVCDAELALNRRTAPDLYLEVRSVNRLADGTLGFTEGEPRDWLVVMRRFADGDLLAVKAARGVLDGRLIRDLADEIAGFHENAQIVLGSGAARVRRVIGGNHDSMSRLHEGALPKSDCEALHAQSMSDWQSLSALLDKRGAGGHIRHCHGDLHLANICLWRGKPTLFDCLEFDAELATTDVLYDLAFLVMDLWEKGFRQEASLLFNRYLDRRDESTGLAAFPLFMSMRAAIRAHVNATAAGQQTSEGAQRVKLESARDYLRAARSLLETSAPRLVAVGGLSGTGKSTLAASLAPRLGGAPGARWLRTDVLRKRMAGLSPEEQLPRAAYTREHSTVVYHRLLQAAEEALASGRSVIIDGVFAGSAERASASAAARSANVEFIGLWLTASPARLIERVTNRVGDASDADRHVVEQQLVYEIGDLSDWHSIDAEGSPDAVLASALSSIA